MTSHAGLVAVYADESCLGNGRDGENPGGAGGLVEYRAPGSTRIVRRDYWISEPATTNNRMALRSVIEAFRALTTKGSRFSVVFVSDSQYLIKGMTEWVHGWAGRGWRRKGGEIENLDLWWKAIESVDTHDVQWKWVRGHDGHPQNEYANLLATRAADEQSASSGLEPSQFLEWLDGERRAGRMAAEPEPYPSLEQFRPSNRLPPVPAMRLPG
jgi:ribonuclease HI